MHNRWQHHSKSSQFSDADLTMVEIFEVTEIMFVGSVEAASRHVCVVDQLSETSLLESGHRGSVLESPNKLWPCDTRRVDQGAEHPSQKVRISLRVLASRGQCPGGLGQYPLYVPRSLALSAKWRPVGCRRGVTVRVGRAVELLSRRWAIALTVACTTAACVVRRAA